MRTSKKLLSFFLAVVMVITTCSVGFTAFAKDYDSIWKTQCEADDAFATLNGLADKLPPLLMGIEAISTPIYEKKAKEMGKDVSDLTDEEKEDINNKVTLPELLGVLQPTLLNALAGSSQEAFVTDFLGAPSSDIYHYNYLNAREGSLSFYTIFNICLTYFQDDSVSSETRAQLEEWLFGPKDERVETEYGEYAPNSLFALAFLYMDYKENSSNEESELAKIGERFDYESPMAGQKISATEANLYELKQYDFNITPEEQAIVQKFISKYNAMFAVVDFPVVLEDFADLYYYGMGSGASALPAVYYTYLIAAGNGKGSLDISCPADVLGYDLPIEATGVTASNILEKLEKATFDAYAANPETSGIASFQGLGEMFGVSAEYAKAFFEDILYKYYVEEILLEGNGTGDSKELSKTSRYTDMVKGLAVKFGNVSLDELNDGVDAKMPKTDVTDEEFADMTAVLDMVKNRDGATEYFRKGEVTYNRFDFVENTTSLPASLKGTLAAEYFALINEKSDDSNTKAYARAFYESIMGKQVYNGLGDFVVDEETGQYAVNENGNFIISNRDTNPEAFKSYIEDARNFNLIQASVAALEKNGVEVEVGNSGSTGFATVIDIDNVMYAIMQQVAGTTDGVVLTPEQEAVLNADYDFTGEIGTELVNYILNSTVVSLIDQPLLGTQSIQDIINSLVVTNVNVVDAIDDIWSRLVENPVSTIVELLPLLVVAVDELLEAFVLNGDGDQYNDAIYGILGSVVPVAADLLFLDRGSYIGFTQIGWDLNELLPALMHWLEGDDSLITKYYNDGKETTVTLKETDDHSNVVDAVYTPATISTADFAHYTIKDTNGNEITSATDENGQVSYTYNDATYTAEELVAEADGVQFKAYITYEANVPCITGIYIADKALKYAKISDLADILAKALGDNATIGTGLAEIIAEVAQLFTAAVDKFVADDSLRNAPKYSAEGNVTGRGLNNVFVGLPQLFDIMENLAAEKYGVPQDAWVYCYDGKIDYTFADHPDQPVNTRLETFKSFASKPDSVKIFDCFVDIFVGDWLNSIITLLNNVISTDGSVISESLPIVTGLLKSLDGFGENSIFTDIFNSIFQLKRGDKYSFEFSVQPNGFTGLDADNAYFLITNIEKLVDVITELVNSFSKKDEGDAGIDTASLLNSLTAGKEIANRSSEVGSSGFTADELKSVDTLIAQLDEMISSLLSASSINDYAINTTGNIASGVVSLLSNYISADDAQSIIGLLDSYLYYLDGEGARTPDENGNYKPEEVYTDKNLTDIVVRTFALLENIVTDLLKDYDYNKDDKNYNILAEAIYGVISPDAIGIRLDDYDSVQKSVMKLTSWGTAINDEGKVTKTFNWGIDDGNSDQFFNGLAASLRVVTSILSVLLVDAGIYQNALLPIFEAIDSKVDTKNEIKVDTVAEYKDDEVVLGLIRPIVGWFDTFLAAPFTTLVGTGQGVAGILDDNSGATIASIVSNTVTPVYNEIMGVATILNTTSDELGAASPTLAQLITDWANANIAPLTTVENNQLVNLKIKDLPLCGANIIPIVNTFLSALGINLSNIDWSALANAKSPADALAFVLEYLVENITTNKNLDAIAALIKGDSSNDTIDTLFTAIKVGKINSKGLVKLLVRILDVTQNPTLFAWSFEKYLQEAIENFSYPLGLSKTQANEAVTDIDKVINNIFPLLSSLGVNLGGSDLKGVLNSQLFTNALLSKLAVAMYNALDSNATIKQVLGIFGIDSSTGGLAKILTDTSYGATFSEAANAIASKNSWSEFITVTKNDKGEETTNYPTFNWGFTDGAANAQQGFVNALVGILRPLEDVLAVFLNGGALEIGSGVYDILATLNVEKSNLADGATLEIKNGVVIITVVDASNAGSKPSTIKLDLTSLENLKNLKIFGTNAYNSAFIPLLEAFGCTDIKTYAEYQQDAAAAKDNILLNVLNPIVGSANTSLLSKICAKPIETIATILPNVAAFIDAHGLSQFVLNLIAPVTDILDAAFNALDADAIVYSILGKFLSDYVAELLGMSAGSVTIDLRDLSSLNVEDMIIPIIRKVLAGNSNEQVKALKLRDINWNALISLGTKSTYTSKATDLNGNALTGKCLTDVDYGKVLITVLRYVLDTVKDNIDPISTLILNINTESDEKKPAKYLKDDATLAPILNNVFTQIKTHSTDQIIVAIYYFFVGDNTDTYWDYTNYITKSYNFKYPQGVSEADVKRLVTFLDQVIEQVDLNAILNQYLYTDDIINQLAKALYTGLGGVKISDTIKLTDILDIVGIKCDIKSVSAMLADSSYGETKQFKSATDAITAAGSWDKVDFSKLSWGVKDQDTFLNAFVAVLRPFDGLLDVLLADGKLNILEGINIPGSNDYENSIVPLLEVFDCEGIKSYDKYLADKNKATDNLLLDVLKPLLGFVDKVVANPLETIAAALPNLALFIANDGVVQFAVNLLTPIIAIVKDVSPIIDVDRLLQELTKIEGISVTNLGKFLQPVLGGGNLIKLVNSLINVAGLEIPEIDWFYLASLGTVKEAPSAVKTIGTRIRVDGNSNKVIIAVLRYVLNFALDNKTLITGLLGDSYKGTVKDILDMVFKLKADKVISLVFSLLDITQSPAEVYWCYENYKSQFTSFKYPAGISAKDADNAVGQLDNAVSGVFALLQSLGVVDSASLSGLVNDMLFTNKMVTDLAKLLYGSKALGSKDVAPYMEMLGIPVSTKEFAKVLTDKSYGKTYSSAAKAIKSAKNWDKVGKVNWGFTDGSAKAEQGFVNAVVAVLRPFIDILGPFLNGTDLKLGNIVYDLVKGLNVKTGDKSKGETLVIFKNGVLDIRTQTNNVYSSALKIDFKKVTVLKDLSLYGSNAYESAIIPLLDVLQVENSEIRTYSQYVKDCKKAKDNVLLDVLNPLMSFVDRVLDAPFDTITSVLPNLAYFIDNSGITQLLNNVLSPVTELVKTAKKDGVDVDKIIKLVAGKDLGKLITDLIGLNGVKLNLKLADLNSCNIQDIVVPLINKLLKSTGIKLPKFTWATIASHGEVVTSKSQAHNTTGKMTNKEVIADKGETLVAVLRYLADTIISNSGSLKKLLCNIDAIKKNDMISSIIKSVFNTLSTATPDQVVLAIFYFLTAEPTNAFWDYTAYKTGEYDFTYPESMDIEFLKSLPPMLDGLVGGLLPGGLSSLITDNLYKDEIVSKLAIGLYGAIEGVKVGDGTLANLLAQTGIDFTTSNVAKLLTDEAYGQSYSANASIIANAGSWSKVSESALKWGVKDRDSFFHALVAVLRPIYGVLDVLLNDAYLGLFNIVRIPGSNGYTSSIVPLLEAFSAYNVKTQYQYREDINNEYDAILLDIINPLWDKVEDILNAPLQTLFAMLPNLGLFIGNNGLCQIIDNLLTPVSALVDAIKPIVNLNDLLGALLPALGVDLNSLLGQIGITNFNLDLYDLNATLKPLLGGDAIVPLLNNILGVVKIGGSPLGLKLNDIDWLQLASHGKTIVSASQAATYGSRIFVEGDSSETLIAVLRYLINTINTGDNFDKITGLIGGLLGNADETLVNTINDVLDVLKGDADTVISSLVELLQQLGG